MTLNKNLIDKLAGSGSKNAINVANLATLTAITSNDISNASVASIAFGGGNDNASVSNNTIINDAAGIVFNGGASSGIVVTQNSLLSPGLTALNDGSTGAVDATKNFWGNASGPFDASRNITGGGSTISGFGEPNVTFSPWLGDGTDTSPAIGFQPNLTPLYGIATQLVFITQPSTSNTVNQPLFTQPIVEARDANNNRAFSFNGAITLILVVNPSDAALGGTNTLFGDYGDAPFTNVSVSKIGSGYKLRALSPGLASADSVAFDVATLLRLDDVPRDDIGGIHRCTARTFHSRRQWQRLLGIPSGVVEFA